MDNSEEVAEFCLTILKFLIVIRSITKNEHENIKTSHKQTYKQTD